MLMAKARRRFWAFASRRLEASGDSLPIWQVLCHLKRVQRSTQANLAVAVGQEPPHMSRLLDNLELQQLVRRDRDSEDRRRIYVSLTRRGQQRYGRMKPSILEAAEQCFEPLNAAERRTLRDLLAKLVADAPRAGLARAVRI